MDLKQEQARIDKVYQERSIGSPEVFVMGLKIPSATGPMQFSACVVGFQWECFEELFPSLEAIKKGRKPPIRRFWWERTKGASKDSDIGAALLWLVAFATRPIYIQIGAADKDQAAIVKRRIENILHYNPWLEELVRIHNYKISTKENGLGVIDIVAADV